MRASLSAITEELQRLKAAGVRAVPVTDEALRRLRAQVEGLRADALEPAAPQPAPTPVTAGPSRSAVRTESSSEPARPAAVATLPAPPAVSLPAGDKATRWAALRECVLNDPVCRAHVKPGKQVVFGVGNIDACIMFVGEAPGAEEEVQGEPFVGPAGQLLTKMIQGMGLQRSDVYIGNIMNWRPEITGSGPSGQIGNRPPTEEEMRYCLPYLRAQIEVVAPALLVALGKTAVEGLLGFNRFKTLGEARGRWHEFAGLPLMVTYHPSYILREPTNKKKRLIWEDLLQVMEKAELPISDKQRGYFLGK
jgi:uracil-DNA glycosylase family 4